MKACPLSGFERVLEVVGGLGGWSRDPIQHRLMLIVNYFLDHRIRSVFDWFSFRFRSS
ncbi:MAG: hypothetical protein ACP6IP_06170 [Candidatus Njordarchaeia archaeon]